ncbi:MAG: carbon-nitrogen hydrolase family protein, partial [Gammaproteobacteria bacterium]
LEQAEQLINEAVKQEARFITLPENFPLMGKEDADRLNLAESPGAGPIQAFLSEHAKQHGIWLLGGTIPLKTDRPDKVFAASLLYAPSGETVAHYNKVHLFDVLIDEGKQEAYQESATFAAGSDIVVTRTEIGNIGLSVCYDLRFPEIYRAMHRDQVQIITAPSAFTATTGEAHWETLLRSRAIENLCYVVASNQGGLHANGRRTWGHSMIVDPWGHVLDCFTQGPGMAIASIDLDKQARLRQMFPALQHIRLTP